MKGWKALLCLAGYFLGPLAKRLTPSTKCDLLVVDDEANYRLLIGAILQERIPDLHIQYAADGLEGLMKAKALKPPLVWTCVRMPRMDGLEMIRRIRQSQGLQNAKIILCTGYSWEYMKTHVLELGVEFLQKPFKFEEAARTILSGLAKTE